MVCYCSKPTDQHFSIKFFYKILVPQVLKQIFRKKQSWEWVWIPESNGNTEFKSNRFLLLFSCIDCFFVFLTEVLLRPSSIVTLIVISKRALQCAGLPNQVTLLFILLLESLSSAETFWELLLRWWVPFWVSSKGQVLLTYGILTGLGVSCLLQHLVLADNEWQRFRGQAVIHSYKQLCFCGAHENSCLGQWSHFVDLYPILKNLEFTLLIRKYLFMNYTKV